MVVRRTGGDLVNQRAPRTRPPASRGVGAIGSTRTSGAPVGGRTARETSREPTEAALDAACEALDLEALRVVLAVAEAFNRPRRPSLDEALAVLAENPSAALRLLAARRHGDP